MERCSGRALPVAPPLGSAEVAAIVPRGTYSTSPGRSSTSKYGSPSWSSSSRRACNGAASYKYAKHGFSCREKAEGFRTLDRPTSRPDEVGSIADCRSQSRQRLRPLSWSTTVHWLSLCGASPTPPRYAETDTRIARPRATASASSAAAGSQRPRSVKIAVPPASNARVISGLPATAPLEGCGQSACQQQTVRTTRQLNSWVPLPAPSQRPPARTGLAGQTRTALCWGPPCR